ncbi:unnamed protein product [Cyprideis torosa]|uniref:Uncharacterized protein n=1 Tax=Cyprideis torosa TaxID=163714 RepID=A0A7R8ZL79_9CRUS|nr:unnamed protein product [Cyprideis torosa]CAG0883040.1 unnamed protein product [Cyprideis torosa]
MCGGYTCSKNTLTGLNIFYILTAFILMGVATYGKAANIVTSVSIVGGIIVCGVILLLVSVLGLFGAVRHHQVMLFFYMVILFLLFILQFSIAIACLGVGQNDQIELASQGWDHSSNATRLDAQQYFDCCGFGNFNSSHPTCLQVLPRNGCCPEADNDAACCRGAGTCVCPLCDKVLRDNLRHGLKLSGGVGLFFSFTEKSAFFSCKCNYKKVAYYK